MPWLELRIHTTRDKIPPFELALECVNALSITYQDSADTPIFEPAIGETPLWQNTRITGLFEAGANTQAIEKAIPNLDATDWVWHVVEDKDWEREWMNSYQPIQCHPKLWICPSWCPPPDPKATNLMLDPGLAFGTGTHPTTFLCLQWLAEQNLTGARVVDYGCGSGILGIAALLLGASDALGVDIDPQALIASAENASRNHIPSASFPVYLPEKAPVIQAHVVMANILAGPLINLADVIQSYLGPHAKLCLSGILASQAKDVMAAYEATIAFDPIRTREDWALLTGTVRA